MLRVHERQEYVIEVHEIRDDWALLLRMCQCLWKTSFFFVQMSNFINESVLLQIVYKNSVDFSAEKSVEMIKK